MNLRAWKSALLVLLISGTLTGLTALAYEQGLFDTSNSFLYDLRMNWRGKLSPSGAVVLVLMDEQSSKELKRLKGNWSRTQLSSALENLCQARAEIIGLDMVLAASDANPETDPALAKAIYDCNNVVLARILASPGTGDIRPLSLFQDAMIGDGFIDLNLDRDEILRRIRFLSAKPLADGGLSLLPAFSLELARSYLNLDFDFDFSQEDAIRVGGTGQERLRLPYPELLIDYFGTWEDFPALSYADVVLNRFSPEAVSGKIVLLGSSLFLQKDFFVTPLTRFRGGENEYGETFGTVVEQVSNEQDLGVAIHAHAIETILAQRFIQPLAHHWLLAMLIAIGLLSLMFYLPRLHLALTSAFFVSGITTLLAGSYLLFLRQQLVVDIAPMLALLTGQFVAGIFYQRRVAKQRAARIQNLFGKYVSPAVARELVESPIDVSLQGQRRELSILFSDIRGFTTLSEKLDAQETGLLLNAYFNNVLPVIFEHRGTVDKLIGDAIMAFFGAPLDLPDHPIKAAETALAMTSVLDAFQRSGIANADQLVTGIGINTGTVTLGNLGSDRFFMDYTVIGDAVNLASRLESLTKLYGVRIILGESTFRQLDDRFLTRELDIVKVKGKNEPVTIHELVGYKETADRKMPAILATFSRGLDAYRSQQWQSARNLFGEVLQQHPEDGPSRLYLQRMDQSQKLPLPEDWDGVTVLDHK